MSEVRINTKSLDSKGESNDLACEHNKCSGKGKEETPGEAEASVITAVSERDS